MIESPSCDDLLTEDFRSCPDSPSCDDLLTENFRNSISCQSLAFLNSLGLTLAELLSFQKKSQRDARVVYPWDEDYNNLRQNVDRLYNVYPLVIIMAERAKGIQQALLWANAYHIFPRLRGGAHSLAAFSLGEGIILDQSRCKNVRVRPEARTVKFGAGVTSGEVAEILWPYRLALPTGTCASVGLAGLTLGGGLGFLMREYGITADSLLEVRVVLANGKRVRANAKHRKELYWAHRGGGGGNFGVVTSFKFQVYPITTAAIFRLDFPFALFGPIFDFFQRWAPHLPNKLTANLNSFGKTDIVTITGLYLDGIGSLEPLLADWFLFSPINIDLREIPYIDAVREFNGGQRRPPYRYDHNMFFSAPASPPALEIMRHFLTVAEKGDKIEVYALGGYVNHIPSHETAFVHRNESFWFLLSSSWVEFEETPGRMNWVNSFFSSLYPYSSQRAYVNMPNTNTPDYLDAYYGKNLERLMTVKTKYDPENIFHFPQSIPPHSVKPRSPRVIDSNYHKPFF